MRSLPSILLLGLLAVPATVHADEAVRLIFDTDMMGDVDDVGTVAVLHALANRGDRVPFPHTLMLGPPGLGKTEISKITAQELACGFHELLASAIKNPAEVYAVLMNAKDGDLVLIDAIDCLDKTSQTALLSATVERTIYVPNAAGGAPHAIKLASFSIVGATTELKLKMQSRS
jgi:Holliday junction DNA helicase RuvB